MATGLNHAQAALVEEDTDLMSFNNRYSNGIVFPAMLAIGLVLNAFPITNLLLRGIKIWIHEFGHATVAWLSGRQAIPLPIGWTNVNPDRSFWVYLGVLILLGLLYWSGHKEGKRWPMVLAAGLALLQFAMTWLMSPNTFDMLLAFGGIGGELYLSTLLMVSFFFPMPAYWRWDFYRYPVVIGAAFTFWGQFWLWKAIRLGRASIPFGMMWGDAEHGDMNILVNRHAWEPGTIIGTYNTIANLCFLVIVGGYAYVLYRQHRHRFWLMLQR
ncbi:MAG: M50 family metallopeptidase [Spirulina sp.]